MVHCQRDLMDLDHSYQPTLALGVLLQLCLILTMGPRSDRSVGATFLCPCLTAHQDGLSKITKEKNGFVFGSKKSLEFPIVVTVQPTTLVPSSVNPTRQQGRFSYCLYSRVLWETKLIFPCISCKEWFYIHITFWKN